MKFAPAVVFFAAVFAAGCATAPKPVLYEALSEDGLRIRLRQTAFDIKPFSAEGTVTVNTPTMTQAAGFDLSTRGMDSLKINIYGPFGITLGSALYTRQAFMAYNALNNTVYRGSPEKRVSNFPFAKDIPLELFVSSFQGIYFPRHFSTLDSLTLAAQNYYRFVIANDNGTVDHFEYNERINRITKCTRRTAVGAPLWSVEYTYDRTDGGIIMPESVEITVPQKELTLFIEYDDVRRDTIVQEFSLSYPDDASFITIE